jgi:hypothetical protein
MRLARLLGAFLLLSMALPAAGASREDAQAELSAALAKWRTAEIADYEIRVRDESCYCLYGPYYGPIRNVVEAGELRASYYEGERRDGYWHGRKVRIETRLRATVEDLFSRIERLIATAPDGSYRVEYDPKFGFPALVDFDDPGWEDEQWRLVTDGFKPARPRR